ncbi:MAG: hypothetical protein P1Q69_06020 [Candidatus Thorarchaeota archaeon]|nr:hypothetical protein [Candidatus Thorarchaeota archaeon]
MRDGFSVCEIQSKTIANESKIPDVELVVNPYVGCQHGCSYRYAKFMMRFTGHAFDKWGKHVDVKINAPEILEKQLDSMRKRQRVPVLLSSVTDAYQPVERRFEITRKCIQRLSNHSFPISVLTKSNLVRRNLDIISGNPKSEVGMTTITLD